MENYTREELEKMLEKAKKDLREAMEKLSPEERAEAEERARKMIADDEAERKRLLENASQILEKPAQPETLKPKFCKNCGAPAGSGKFCEYCGQLL